MQNNKKQIIYFLICILFILGGLCTALYWMNHIDHFKKNGMGIEKPYSILINNKQS